MFLFITLQNMLSIMLIAFIQSNIHTVSNRIYSTYPIPTYLPPPENLQQLAHFLQYYTFE